MKADQFGTHNEQKRHRVNWGKGIHPRRCQNCRFASSHRTEGQAQRYYCAQNLFATRALAGCDEFKGVKT